MINTIPVGLMGGGANKHPGLYSAVVSCAVSVWWIRIMGTHPSFPSVRVSGIFSTGVSCSRVSAGLGAQKGTSCETSPVLGFLARSRVPAFLVLLLLAYNCQLGRGCWHTLCGRPVVFWFLHSYGYCNTPEALLSWGAGTHADLATGFCLACSYKSL